MYYICTEIWEEPRLPPFFVTFPLKSGVLEAHPVKICLPLVFLCLPQILIRGRQRKIMRREGKIGRRKVFPKVKNVNVESLKKRSKLLDFLSGSLPQPLPKGKGFSISPLMPINCLINCPINFWTFHAFRVPKPINGFLMNQIHEH